jgi:hypothetical protein
MRVVPREGRQPHALEVNAMERSLSASLEASPKATLSTAVSQGTFHAPAPRGRRAHAALRRRAVELNATSRRCPRPAMMRSRVDCQPLGPTMHTNSFTSIEKVTGQGTTEPRSPTNVWTDVVAREVALVDASLGDVHGGLPHRGGQSLPRERAPCAITAVRP